MPRIDQCTYAVVDVETTGINAGQHRVVEIAVLTCDWTGAVTERFETLVRPDCGALTGARSEMLADAPLFAEVAGDVLDRLGGGVVAGHNVSFDLRFIDSELARVGLRMPTHAYVCTRNLATLLGCDVTNRTLAALCTYFGVAFDRWHTAADDTAATAAVLAHLLARATSFGRVDLTSIQSWWAGMGTVWPERPSGGPVLIRDAARWPPAGDQPGSRRATEASFRRLGEGPASPSGATVLSESAEAPSPARSASELWWQGDFRGLDGITQLQDRVLPAFRATNDPELLGALLALADLLRRHGGRDREVRDTFAEAAKVAEVAEAAELGDVERVVEPWWSYLAALRDVDGLVALMGRSVDPVARVASQVVSFRSEEPVVAERLARVALAGLTDDDQAGQILLVLCETLESAGRQAEAVALLEGAWSAGSHCHAVLDRLSQVLEQSQDYAGALDVCARALAANGASLVALRKRHRRCQERLAHSATLFG